MNNRFYVNDVQIFGNNEMFKNTYVELERQRVERTKEIKNMTNFFEYTTRLKGYRKAFIDIINFIDNHSTAIKYTKSFNVDLIKSFFNCLAKESEELFRYGDFVNKELLLITPKDKKQKRYFKVREVKNG